ncbi:hypothetical protein [Enterococcus faecalis]|nr:hypothetical protein [Enterococcus faecalis]
MNQYRKTQKQQEIETVAAKERRKKEQLKWIDVNKVDTKREDT